MKHDRLIIQVDSESYKKIKAGKQQWYSVDCRSINVDEFTHNRLIELESFDSSLHSLWLRVNEVTYVCGMGGDTKQNRISDQYSDSALDDPTSDGVDQVEIKNNCILMHFELIEQPTIIKLEDQYIDLVLHGEKTSTIRRGKRNYNCGDAIVCSEKRAILVCISKIEYSPFAELTNVDAKNDGFSSLTNLIDSLYMFYPDLDGTSTMTIVSFRRK